MKIKIDVLFYRTYQMFIYLIFIVRWRMRLKKCGKRSYWVSPSRIINPSKINIGKNTVILNSARIEIHNVNEASQGISIGNGVNIGHNFFCSSAKCVSIEDGVLISDNVAIIDNNHIHKRGMTSTKSGISSNPIKIGKNATIYRNSTILSGVKIGEGSIVAAHSLVKNDVEPNTIVGGCPAIKINDL